LLVEALFRLNMPVTESPLDRLLLQSPFWLLGILILGAMIAAALIGWRARLWQNSARANSPEDDIGERQEGHIVAAVLGLLALLTGFTFALALERYDTRRERVLSEANAIGTTYLRTQLLAEPYRSRISSLLTDYADTRLQLASASRTNEARLLHRNDRSIIELWKATVAAFPTVKPYDFSNSYIEAMNAVIDSDAARKVARKAHVPSEVYLVLLLYQFGTGFVLGYVLVGRNGRISAILLIVLFSTALLLIIDIDRPTTGWIRESQAPMIRLQEFLHANPPSTFGRQLPETTLRVPSGSGG